MEIVINKNWAFVEFLALRARSAPDLRIEVDKKEKGEMLPCLFSPLVSLPRVHSSRLRSQGQSTAARRSRHAGPCGLSQAASTGGTRGQNGGTSLPRWALPASSVATEGQSSPPRSSSFLFCS
jgi:hypothetical protein